MRPRVSALRIAFGLVVALALAGGSQAADDGPVVVRLRDRAVVEGPQVFLRDVATVEGGHPYLREQIARLDLLLLPLSGRAAPVSRLQLGIRIELAGLEQEAFRLEGAAAVRVEPARASTLEAYVEAAARQQLAEECPEAAVVKLAIPPIPAPGGHPDDIFAEPRVVSPGGGQRVIPVEVVLRVKSVRQPPVALLFHLRGRGPVLEPPSGAEESTAPLGPARPAAREPVIHARDPVTIVVQYGTARVSAQGEALQNGEVGQVIRVRNTDSNKVLTGRVLSASVVAVHYEKEVP